MYLTVVFPSVPQGPTPTNFKLSFIEPFKRAATRMKCAGYQGHPLYHTVLYCNVLYTLPPLQCYLPFSIRLSQCVLFPLSIIFFSKAHLCIVKIRSLRRKRDSRVAIFAHAPAPNELPKISTNFINQNTNDLTASITMPAPEANQPSTDARLH